MSLPLGNGCSPGSCGLCCGSANLLITSLSRRSRRSVEIGGGCNACGNTVCRGVINSVLMGRNCGLCFCHGRGSALRVSFFVHSTRSLVPIRMGTASGTAESLTGLATRSNGCPSVGCNVGLYGGGVNFGNGFCAFPCFLAFLLGQFIEERE